MGKWENRSRFVMYLGPLPTHARKVNLILSIKTGLVSPQFHVKFDNYFESIKWEGFMPRSKFQYKARLVKESPSSTPDFDRGTIMQMIGKSSNTQNKPSSTIDPRKKMTQATMEMRKLTLMIQATAKLRLMRPATMKRQIGR